MSEIIGKTEPEAETFLKKLGKCLRVTERDGEPYLGTTDYNTDRVNVKVLRGKVIQIVGIG